MKFSSVSAGVLLSAHSALFSASAASCKCLPGDLCWPSTTTWDALNSTVNGGLIATVPLASPCHDPTYDAAKCAVLQNSWLEPTTHLPSSSSVMAPFFANQSCDPFTSRTQTCKLGNYVSYAVNASSEADIVAAVNFAQAHNVRFIIRNTGHDYHGKSTGAGALSVWTHYLKDISFSTWSDENYNGKAITVGAGVQGYEAMAAAKTQGLVAVGGECSTVGVAGGYTQGGGHSALSTNFGLAADQTLSWRVVTAAGQVETASRTENSDLYWALSGGGGGTYGVVVSLTARAYPDAIVGGGTLAFYPGTDANAFYAAIETFHEYLPALIDAGGMVIYYFGSAFFQIAPLTAYGKTSAQVKAIMAPLLTALDSKNVTYTAGYTDSATYQDHYNTYFGPLPNGAIQVGIAQYGGRLIPRDVITNSTSDFIAAARNITEAGATFIGVGTDVSSFAANVNNSVFPGWRKAIVHATLTLPWNFTAPWSEALAVQNKMTNEIVPQMESVTPGAGAYMNEADWRQPDWKETFFGANYDSLLAIKNKWDPNGLFYAVISVGSDAWSVAKDGRMCRA